jgi:CRISP-associated protein Cas1
VDVQLNTLFVMTRGATVRRDHLTVQVLVDKKVRLTVPVHQIESVAAFGGVHVTPSAMALLAEHGAAVAFLTASGRLVCRVDAPHGGNVLLRREQYRRADCPVGRANVARNLVAGKIQNARNLLLRTAREAESDEQRRELARAPTAWATTCRLCRENRTSTRFAAGRATRRRSISARSRRWSRRIGKRSG